MRRALATKPKQTQTKVAKGSGLSVWNVTKGVWAAVITVVTLAVGWMQLEMTRLTIRPSLIVDLVPATADVLERHGSLSHAYRLENGGALLAKDVTVSVRTYWGGATLHEDRQENIGDLVAREVAGYVVHVSDGTKMYEDFEVAYVGSRGLRFWCLPRYVFKASFQYDKTSARWVSMPRVKSVEIETCGIR